MSDPELSALVDQAARNLETLEMLTRASGAEEHARVLELQRCLHELHRAYIRETDALTQHVLLRAMERRSVPDRRAAERAEARRSASVPMVAGPSTGSV